MAASRKPEAMRWSAATTRVPPWGWRLASTAALIRDGGGSDFGGGSTKGTLAKALGPRPARVPAGTYASNRWGRRIFRRPRLTPAYMKTDSPGSWLFDNPPRDFTAHNVGGRIEARLAPSHRAGGWLHP